MKEWNGRNGTLILGLWGRPFPYIQEFCMKNKLLVLKSIWTCNVTTLLSGSTNSMASSTLNLVVRCWRLPRCPCPSLDMNQTIRSSCSKNCATRWKLSLPSTPTTLSTQKPWGSRNSLMTKKCYAWSTNSTIGDLCRLCRHHPVCWTSCSRPFRKQLIRAGSPLTSTIRSRAIRPIWTISSLLRGWGKMTTSRLMQLGRCDSSWSWFCKLATCMSNMYHDQLNGIKSGYAKFETFPVWNLPLHHPVNLAYEATADLDDVNMIEPFHLQTYGKQRSTTTAILKSSLVLKRMLNASLGTSPYASPTDMGSIWLVLPL